MANLPKDEAGVPIPALSLRPGGYQKIDILATTQRSTPIAGDSKDTVHSAKVVSLYATVACHIEFGDETVEATVATSHYYPAGIYYDFAMKKSETHIAVIRSSEDGVLHISEKD